MVRSAPAGERLKEKTPRVTGRSGEHRQRRAMKSPRIIEAAGHPDSGTGRSPASF
ncbi:hypothetical protein [Bacillus amyloliquefaciens]|uniref:hypothetical protein n=1 Tax=Bacillus amyloliquefaciens TaxID=1390 RepID=UPI001CD27D21|nr:hypothetical protein [Bacillus amyloliquefaciens]